MSRFAGVSKSDAKTQLCAALSTRQMRHLYRLRNILLACCATQLAESASYKQGRRHELQSLRVVLTVQVVNCRCLCFPLLDAGKEFIQEPVHGRNSSHDTCCRSFKLERYLREDKVMTADTVINT
jgi:hypothetical protein